MTWNLPKGRGTIKGEERLLYSKAISEITTEILFATNGEFCAGVGIFDSIPSCGKLLMLDYVQYHLFEKTKEIPESNAVVDGTFGAVIQFLRTQIKMEVDVSRCPYGSGRMDPTYIPDFWRRLVFGVVRERKWKNGWKLRPNGKKKVHWDLIMDRLHDRVLSDADYELAWIGNNMEEQTGLHQVMGMPPSYFESIPVKEPSATKMVEVIQRLIKLPSKAFALVRGINPDEPDF